MSPEMSESESQMEASSKDVRNRREQNWKDLGTACPVLHLEKTEAQGCQGICPHFFY